LTDDLLDETMPKYCTDRQIHQKQLVPTAPTQEWYYPTLAPGASKFHSKILI